MISWKPKLVPKAPPPNTITLGLRVSTYEFGGKQTFSLQQVDILEQIYQVNMGPLDEHIPWKDPQNSSFTKTIKGMCSEEGPGTIEKCLGVSPLWAGLESRGTSLWN